MLGIDQYGQSYFIEGKHPRKELIKAIGYSSAVKIYRERKDGTSYHCGYKVGPHWVDLYETWQGEGR